MKREDRRRAERERNKLSKTISKLSDNQTILIDKLAEERALDMFKKIEVYIFDTVKKH